MTSLHVICGLGPPIKNSGYAYARALLPLHVLLHLVIFMTKQKPPRNIFEWIISLFTAKVLQEANVPYFSLPGPNHLQNSTPKRNNLNLFWTYIVSKKRIEQFNFFNWLSKVKNVVFSNGSEHERMVILLNCVF